MFKARKTIAFITAVIVLLAMMPVLSEGFVQGASDPVFKGKRGGKLTYRSVTVTRDRPFSLKLNRKGKAAKAKASGKGILSIRKTGKNQWVIRGLKPGKATIKVKQKKKTYKCKVTVLPFRVGKRSMTFIGHRGYAELYPENTRIALQKAMQAGFRGVAFDLVPTRQDVQGNFDFAVSHDDTLSKMTASKGTIRTTLAADLRKMKVTRGHNAKKYNQKLIFAAEAIDITRKYNGIAQIEMKDVWTSAQTDRLASLLKAKNAPNSWQIEALDEDTLARFDESQKKYGLDLKLNLVVQKAMDPKTRIDIACNRGFDNIQINTKRVNQWVVDYCRQKGIGIGAYAAMSSDANAEAKRMSEFHPDWLCVSDIPWY